MIYDLQISGSGALLDRPGVFVSTTALFTTDFAYGPAVSQLHVTPPFGVGEITNNGANLVELGLYVGNVSGPPDRSGEIQWASNSAVHVANSDRTGVTGLFDTAVDETFQNYDAASRTLTIELDSRVAGDTTTDRFIGAQDASGLPIIDYGEMTITFSPDFRSLSGTATFAADGDFGLGRLASLWEADFSGTLSDRSQPFTLPGGGGPGGGDGDRERTDRDEGSTRGDRLIGDGGPNRIEGRGGPDRIEGRGGPDDLRGGKGGDVLIGGNGGDTLRGGAGGDQLRGNKGNDRLLGEGGRDTLSGNKGADRLLGGNGKDELNGGKGDDRLLGGKGVDVLQGALGVDRLTGGPDADRFVFATPQDSSGKVRRADEITDFSQSDGDRIDLSAIDARPGGGDDRFRWIDDDGFSGRGGELRQDGAGRLRADLDGDGEAELTVIFGRDVDLKVGDFLL